MTTLHLVLPMPPNIANGRQHWRVKNQERQKYFNSCAMRVCAKLIPPPPTTPPTLVSITSTMYLGARMDMDNAMHRHKWALDWLKQCGYITDDRPAHLRWADFPEQIVKRDGDYRIALVLVTL